MIREVFFNAAENASISTELANKINSAYQTVLPQDVLKLLGVEPNGCFLEKIGILFLRVTLCRLLSTDEILNASKELHVDFVAHGVIPLFDKSDNNFIVYDYKNNQWKKFNIVDETSYGAKNSLKDILV